MPSEIERLTGGVLAPAESNAPVTGAAVADLPVEPGWAKLTVADDPKYTLLCELGDAPPTPTQGYGGWETVPRAARTGLTAWRGFEPLGIDLALLLDNHLEGKSVERSMQLLEALAGRGEMRRPREDEPPHLIVDTAGVMPHDFHVDRDNRWVITDLDFDEESVIRNDHGNWTRVAVTVSLLQYVADGGLAAQTAAVRRRIHARGKPTKRPYTARAGDTLVSIARRELGDPGRWREISDLNNIRDPRAKLKTGRKLRLP